MRERVAITSVWLTGLCLSVGLIWSYTWTKNEDGLIFISPQSFLPYVGPVIGLYAAYLGGILTLWFLKPFPPSRTQRVDGVRFWLALSCTALFNIAVLLVLARQHLWGGPGDISADARTAVKLAGLLSFLVAPANVFYFGMRVTFPIVEERDS